MIEYDGGMGVNVKLRQVTSGLATMAVGGVGFGMTPGVFIITGGGRTLEELEVRLMRNISLGGSRTLVSSGFNHAWIVRVSHCLL